MLQRIRRTAKDLIIGPRRSIIYHREVDAAARVVRRMWPVKTQFPLRRLGGNSDGAYLIPDDLKGISAHFSPGVASVTTFDEEIAAMHVDCFLADASVSGLPTSNPRFHFVSKYLGMYDHGEVMRLDSWVQACAPGQGDLMLQMDIEDAEWGVLASVSPGLLDRFRIMVIEFHHLADLLFSRSKREVLERLLLTHYVVHAHVNNAGPIQSTPTLDLPMYLEITFLRKDRAQVAGYATEFPHPLDISNVLGRPPLNLPDCWRGRVG